MVARIRIRTAWLTLIVATSLACEDPPREPVGEKRAGRVTSSSPSASTTASLPAPPVTSASGATPKPPSTVASAKSAYRPPSQLDFVRSQGLDVARSETTVGQYRACVQAGRCKAPTIPPPKNFGKPWTTTWDDGQSSLPVNNVDWHEATSFCAWAGARLPTAEEWERIATNGSTTAFPWGDEPVDGTRVNYCDEGCDTRNEAKIDEDGADGAAVVCAYPAGRNRNGICDLMGNLNEWTSSPYPSKPGVTKQARGSAYDRWIEWFDPRRVDWFEVTAKGDRIGFRCVRDITAKP